MERFLLLGIVFYLIYFQCVLSTIENVKENKQVASITIDEVILDGEGMLELGDEHSRPHQYQDNSSQPVQHYCSIFLTISNLSEEVGRGVFAGKFFRPNEIIDESMSLLIPFTDVSQTRQLMDYVYGCHDENYSVIQFGSASFFNSHPNGRAVQNHISPFDVYKPASEAIQEPIPFLNYTDMALFALRYMEPGEEFLNYYGNQWYASRGIDPPAQRIPTIEEQRRFLDTNKYHRVCLNDIAVRASSIDNVGRGLFASKAYMHGEIITVSPVAVLNKTFVDSLAYRTVLQNYCLWDGKAPIVLLPISKAMMMNHQSPPDNNVAMQWFSWLVEDNAQIAREKVEAKWNVTELVESPVCPLDIAFYATRDIAVGEELFLDYGEEWEEAFRDVNG